MMIQTTRAAGRKPPFLKIGIAALAAMGCAGSYALAGMDKAIAEFGPWGSDNTRSMLVTEGTDSYRFDSLGDAWAWKDTPHAPEADARNVRALDAVAMGRKLGWDVLPPGLRKHRDRQGLATTDGIATTDGLAAIVAAQSVVPEVALVASIPAPALQALVVGVPEPTALMLLVLGLLGLGYGGLRWRKSH